MTEEQFSKIKEYRNLLEVMYDNGESWLPDEFEAELFEFFENLIFQNNWSIIAADTHRWVDTDGWYEVEFHLETDFGDVYINNVDGDKDLEDIWSENNPQPAVLSDCGLDYHTWDWFYFLNKLIEKKGINN